MENSVKKKKSKKGLRKRVGIIAVGGLSLVLTVCLSVGATLAWFAGSTWASKSLYMGGPVYVEMAGRGGSGATKPSDGTDANWVGGNGNLDIQAAAGRQTGTVNNTDDKKKVGDYNDILLPGQKVQIYSQARVYSTAETSTVDDDPIANNSSGSNPTNTSNVNTGTTTFKNEKGRVTTTTTSVLRARFSIEVEFDPGMGFNNFTGTDYMTNYPVQSASFAGTHGSDFDSKLTWQDALSATDDNEAVFKQDNSNNLEGTPTYTGRRDGVAKGNWNNSTSTGAGQNKEALEKLKTGTEVSIYKWKYVSEAQYKKAGTSATDPNAVNGIQMGAPFDGTVKTAGGYGYYGVWITEKATGEGATSYVMTESDAFYKARCNAYINTYVEAYENEYGNVVERSIGDSIKSLENSLNEYFVKLINDSSNNIHSGNTGGFTINETTGNMKFTNKHTGENASWLYIDPSIGNDTNTDEISTSVGGWWYLVEDNGGAIGTSDTGDNKITAVYDSISGDAIKTATGANTPKEVEEVITRKNAKSNVDDTDAKIEGDNVSATKYSRLDAKLYEIKPTQDLGEAVTSNGGNVTKVVSNAYPFVNGTFALPSDALTNVFANAKITFKVAFQALQAFFPYTTSIDGVSYTVAPQLFGTAKALSIRNAIPVYNEAFDYQESDGSGYTDLL